MTYPKLSRLISSISDQELISALRSPSKIPIEELDHQIDFSALDEKVDEIIKNNITDSAIDGCTTKESDSGNFPASFPMIKTILRVNRNRASPSKPNKIWMPDH